MLEFFLILLVSFVTEIVQAGWTMGVARNNMPLAVSCTIISSLLSVVIILNVVHNINNLPAIVAGETAGTVVVLQLSRLRL